MVCCWGHNIQQNGYTSTKSEHCRAESGLNKFSDSSIYALYKQFCDSGGLCKRNVPFATEGVEMIHTSYIVLKIFKLS
jgi:hypothetical protein